MTLNPFKLFKFYIRSRREHMLQLAWSNYNRAMREGKWEKAQIAHKEIEEISMQDERVFK